VRLVCVLGDQPLDEAPSREIPALGRGVVSQLLFFWFHRGVSGAERWHAPTKVPRPPSVPLDTVICANLSSQHKYLVTDSKAIYIANDLQLSRKWRGCCFY
jgi:hypothetical protein